MKRAIIGYVKEVTYGTVEVIVPENATDEEVKEAILAHEDMGDVFWTSRPIDVTEWEENPDYPIQEELEEEDDEAR